MIDVDEKYHQILNVQNIREVGAFNPNCIVYAENSYFINK